MSARPRRGAEPGAPVLAVIRIALLLGVLIFGGVTYALQQRPDWEPASVDAVRVMRRAAFGVWAAASAILLALRFRLERARGGQTRPLRIGAWAIGEAAALAGGADYLLSGDARMFVGGLFVMMVSFILFPIRGER
jgi:hypothetical protein